ncbi:MAG: hypothetical protein QGG40_18285, partial [Myxococcota bacterium]|nr:hypothetical protein [Myxococcota bacterium]
MLLIILGLVGCDVVGKKPRGDIVEIEVVPQDATLYTSQDQTDSLTFTVNAIYENGGVEEEYPLVSWSHSNTTAGNLEVDGSFTSVTTNGGRTLVTANSNGLLGSAYLTVIYSESVQDDALVAGAAGAFSGDAESPGDAMGWAYPESGVALPRNISDIAFQ